MLVPRLSIYRQGESEVVIWEISSCGNGSNDPGLVLLEQGQSGSRSAGELVEVGSLSEGAIGGHPGGTDSLVHRSELLGLFGLGNGCFFFDGGSVGGPLSSAQLDRTRAGVARSSARERQERICGG